MVDWQRVLDLTPYYANCDPTVNLQIQVLAGIVAMRLHDIKRFKPWTMQIGLIEERKHELVRDFMLLSKDPRTTKDDFNRVMVWLYQWGDQTLNNPPGELLPKKVCWIKTTESM